MYAIISGIGSYLISKFGVSTALAWLYAGARALQFTLLVSMIAVLINVVLIVYQTVREIFNSIENLATGSTGGSDCLGIITSSTLEAIGFIDAWNTVGPTIFLILFAYFNFHLLSLVFKIHAYITNSISQFALTVK